MRAAIPMAAMPAAPLPFIDVRPVARVDPAGNACLATGHDELDRGLPGGGWPLSRLTELLVPDTGAAELQAIVPVLAMLTRSGRNVLLVNAPDADLVDWLAQHGVARSRLLIIGGHRGAEQLWAIEQATARDDFGALIAWMPADARDDAMHRLDRAVRASQGLGLVLRPIAAARDITPAALRVVLQAGAEGRMQLTLLARRASRAAAPREIALRAGIVLQGRASAGATHATPAPIVPARLRIRAPWPFNRQAAH